MADVDYPLYPLVNYNEEQPSSSHFKLWLIIGLIIAVIVVISIVSFLLSKKTNSEIIDYGSNFERFVKSAKSCEPSRVLYNVSLNLFSIRTDTYTYEMVMKGADDGSCLFHMEIVNYTTNPPQEDLPPIEFFKSLNKTCNIPLEMIETEFEYWKSGSPQAFSNKSYCIYAEQVTMTTGRQQTNTPSNNQAINTNNVQCIESWTCGSWSQCVESETYETRVCSDSNNCGTINNKPQDSRLCQTQTGGTSGTPDTCVTSNDCSASCTNCLSSKQSCVKFAESLTSGMHIYNTCAECTQNSQCKTGYQCSADLRCVSSQTPSNGDLPDYFGCNVKRDCTSPCQNCTEGTQNCMDLGRIISSRFDYSDYSHYYVCGECNDFRYPEGGQCKEGYECSFDDKCVPNFETRCKAEVCENCISGERKYSSSGGFSTCYDCDTNVDCKAGFSCMMAECLKPCTTAADCPAGQTCTQGACIPP